MDRLIEKIKGFLGKSSLVPGLLYLEDAIRDRILNTYPDFREFFSSKFDPYSTVFYVKEGDLKPLVKKDGIMYLGERNLPYILSGLTFVFLQHRSGSSIEDSLSYLIDFLSEVNSGGDESSKKPD